MNELGRPSIHAWRYATADRTAAIIRPTKEPSNPVAKTHIESNADIEDNVREKPDSTTTTDAESTDIVTTDSCFSTPEINSCGAIDRQFSISSTHTKCGFVGNNKSVNNETEATVDDICAIVDKLPDSILDTIPRPHATRYGNDAVNVPTSDSMSIKTSVYAPLLDDIVISQMLLPDWGVSQLLQDAMRRDVSVTNPLAEDRFDYFTSERALGDLFVRPTETENN
jgi:hypothetical protein